MTLVRFFFLVLLAMPAAQAADCPRIVSQSPYITHTLEWMGLESCIVGVSRYDTLERPRTGGIMDPDRDAIAALAPELMLTSDWIKEADWHAAAPPKAKAIRLNGFRGMQEVENNIRTIATAVGRSDGDARAHQFAVEWRKQARAVDAKGLKVLLISACSGNPYSFGRKTWLTEMFTEAGFTVVETHDKVRHIRAGEAVADIEQLIDELRPERIFIFERTLSGACAAILPRTGVKIVSFDGEQFLHPAPGVLLDGLATLAARRSAWQ